MKKFYAWVLITIINLCGNVCMSLYMSIKGFEWYHILLMIGGWVIVIPAINWWRDYFFDLFNVED